MWKHKSARKVNSFHLNLDCYCTYICNGDVNYTLTCWWEYIKNELIKKVICVHQLCINT